MNSTMDSDDVTPVADITKLAGTVFVLIIMNWAFFGALSIQVYSYFQAFQTDRPVLKALVYGVYILQITQTLLLTNTAWNGLVKGFGDVDGLNVTGTTWVSIFLIGGLVGFLVQSFYVHRIYVFSKNKILASFIFIMAICSLGGAVATAIKAEQSSEYSDVEYLLGEMGLWIGCGSSCDVAIVISMCYCLRKRVQYVPFRGTQALVSKIILLTIETGALTASVSIIALVLFFSLPIFFEAPLSLMAQIYSTTMLAALNSRVRDGTMPKPTTWLEHELKFAASHDLETQNSKVNVQADSDSLQKTGAYVAKDEIIIGESKGQMV